MEFCVNCEKEIVKNDNFCSSCGRARGNNTIASGDNSFNVISSEIKDNNIHIGNNYSDSNNIDPSILNIQRSSVKLFWSEQGKLAKRSTFLKLGTWGSIASLIGLILPFLTGNPLTHFMAIIALLIFFPMFLIGISIARSKFMPLLGLKNLEIGTKGNIYVTKITCDCPWCKSEMKLRMVGSKNHKEHLLLCSRNPSQHKIIFDPTVLPEIEEEE
ncbi:conserved hypothetical protein [Xenorhabdus bovienii str. oregonense]|uniref:Zinc-ribbon domain-containing protein n=1 Tax=Xenorhabdus bovienii str. oregonense TaxID=1398202 RepID=A0A077P1K2_XENBV|nr:zinc ribbon domain-containing protein [Xenorhabdus bovienii]CDH04950.1 conserved hypothetical protein [Xenorhabdus bovienii str. oregonense]